MSVEVVQENSVVEIIEENATLVEVTTEGPQGPKGDGGFSGLTVEITADHNQASGESAFFSTGNNELTMLDHTTAEDPIMVKSRSGNFTLTNPFGVVVLPAESGSSVVITTAQSFILWPTSNGWEWTG